MNEKPALEIRTRVANLEKYLMKKIKVPQIEPLESMKESRAATGSYYKKSEKEGEAEVDLQCMLGIPLNRKFLWR